MAVDFKRALQDLTSTFERFDKVLDATTTTEPGRGRRIGSVFHAGALNEATAALHAAMAIVYQSLIERHGLPCTTPIPFSILESDSPEGPWTPVPLEAGSVQIMAVGPAGVSSLLAAALLDAAHVTAIRETTGGVRWKSGELIAEADLEKVARVGKLLQLRCLDTEGEANRGSNATGGPSVGRTQKELLNATQRPGTTGISATIFRELVNNSGIQRSERGEKGRKFTPHEIRRLSDTAIRLGKQDRDLIAASWEQYAEPRGNSGKIA